MRSDTVTDGAATDDEAIIGYDPPLRTFFLQAFMGKRNEIWHGALLEELTTLQQLTEDTREQGYEISNYPDGCIVAVTKLAARHHPPSIGERLGTVR